MPDSLGQALKLNQIAPFSDYSPSTDQVIVAKSARTAESK
jgi:hypothetical protein